MSEYKFKVGDSIRSKVLRKKKRVILGINDNGRYYVESEVTGHRYSLSKKCVEERYVFDLKETLNKL
jgi:hypothetical protein